MELLLKFSFCERTEKGTGSGRGFGSTHPSLEATEGTADNAWGNAYGIEISAGFPRGDKISSRGEVSSVGFEEIPAASEEVSDPDNANSAHPSPLATEGTATTSELAEEKPFFCLIDCSAFDWAEYLWALALAREAV